MQKEVENGEKLQLEQGEIIGTLDILQELKTEVLTAVDQENGIYLSYNINLTQIFDAFQCAKADKYQSTRTHYSQRCNSPHDLLHV